MYFDSLVHEPAKLDYLIKLVGADQVALGSDYPFPLGEASPGSMIDSMTHDDTIRSMLFHGAALNWLNLEKRVFEN
jgi:aminocarboxymuconate-semialdehyde decarboxylase